MAGLPAPPRTRPPPRRADLEHGASHPQACHCLPQRPETLARRHRASSDGGGSEACATSRRGAEAHCKTARSGADQSPGPRTRHRDNFHASGGLASGNGVRGTLSRRCRGSSARDSEASWREGRLCCRRGASTSSRSAARAMSAGRRPCRGIRGEEERGRVPAVRRTPAGGPGCADRLISAPGPAENLICLSAPNPCRPNELADSGWVRTALNQLGA